MAPQLQAHRFIVIRRADVPRASQFAGDLTPSCQSLDNLVVWTERGDEKTLGSFKSANSFEAICLNPCLCRYEEESPERPGDLAD